MTSSELIYARQDNWSSNINKRGRRCFKKRDLGRRLKQASQRGRRRVTTGGVPSGIRWGLWRTENEVGGLF